MEKASTRGQGDGRGDVHSSYRRGQAGLLAARCVRHAVLNQTSEQREETFAQLRAHDPVSWQRPVEDAVVRTRTGHADMVRVSRDHREGRSTGWEDQIRQALVHGEVDGARLIDAEIKAFFVLVSVAGTDTTRHTSSLAVIALSWLPDQPLPS